MNEFDRVDTTATAITTTVCPVCKSAAVTTRARRPDEDSYWRCTACGEIWNINRRTEPQPRGGREWRWR